MERDLPPSFKPYARKVHSQNDEDGVVEEIFRRVRPRSRTFVEIGIGPSFKDADYTNGLEGNCYYLWRQGWSGLFLDKDARPAIYDVKREFVTPLNVDRLFRRYAVRDDLDILSLDIDGADIWVWLALSWRPQVIVISYNSSIDLSVSCAIPFENNFRWDGTNYYGASFSALSKVGRAKGYVPVYSNGVNIVFVLETLCANTPRSEEVFVQKPDLRGDTAARPFVLI